MNLGWRWLLAAISTAIYAIIPIAAYPIWSTLLLAHVVIGVMRQPEATLTAIIVLLTPLLSVTFLSPESLTPVLYYSWYYPLIPMAFLFPDLSRKPYDSSGPTAIRHGPLVGLSGLSLAIGDGIFQIINGCLMLLYTVRATLGFRQILNAPTVIIPLVWLLTGTLLGFYHGGQLTDFSTASAWIWGPLLAFTFSQLSPGQMALYLRLTGTGLVLSSCYGLAIKFLNPAATHPLVKPLLSLGSVHQGMTPGSSAEFTAGGFFFHRLKFAHQSGVLLLTACFQAKWLVAASSMVLLSAIIGSGARWGTLMVFGVALAAIVYRIVNRQRIRLLMIAVLALVGAQATLYQLPSTLRTNTIQSQRSFETRHMMYQSAAEVLHSSPLGLGHGGFKSWSQKHYPTELNNLELPRTLPHNLGLSTLTETGPLGWTCVVLLIVYVLEIGFKGLSGRLPRPLLTRNLSALIVFGTLIFLGLGILHDPLYHRPVAYAWMVLLGVAQHLRRAHSI